MTDINVRVTDSKGTLVDCFWSNDAGFADERIAKLRAKFSRWQPGEVLTVKRSDEQEGRS